MARPLPALLLLLWAALAAVATGEAPCPRTPGPQSTVSRLKQQILQHYLVDEPPTTQGGGPLGVEHAVLIKHVPGVYNNLASIEITIALTWEDSRLRWDPAQFDNLWSMLADASSIWVPFIGIQSHPTNSPDWVDLAEQSCVVSHEGAVVCMSATLAAAHCLSDYRGWPQDLHNCSFHVGSWLLTSDQLFLKDLHLGFAMPADGPWLERQHGFSVTNDSVGPDGRRRSISQVWLLLAHQQAVMDVAAYSAAVGLAVLTLSSLWLPAACGERQALGATSVLAHCVVLVYFSWWLEGGARAPRIVLFHRDGVCAAASALLLVAWAGRLHTSRRAAPAWLRACLARLRQTPAAALLLPPAAQQPEVPAADAPSADAEPPGGDAGAADSDALTTTATAPSAAPAASDAEVWVATSVLVERLGRSGVCAALLAALLRLLLST